MIRGKADTFSVITNKNMRKARTGSIINKKKNDKCRIVRFFFLLKEIKMRYFTGRPKNRQTQHEKENLGNNPRNSQFYFPKILEKLGRKKMLVDRGNYTGSLGLKDIRGKMGRFRGFSLNFRIFSQESKWIFAKCTKLIPIIIENY